MLESFESPESSAVASAQYDWETGVLSVWLKRKGGSERFNYESVPGNLWTEFEQAPSKGTFFSARIRPIYAGRKHVDTKVVRK